VAGTIEVGFLLGPVAPCVSVKVDVVSEAAFMALLNVAETLVLGDTPVANAAGIVDKTVGGTSFVPVVKVQTKLFGIAACPGFSFPALSSTPVVIVAVISVFWGIAADS